MKQIYREKKDAMDAADDEDLSEETIEEQLEEHLQEQKLSLSALEEALVCDPQNEELLEVSPLSLPPSVLAFQVFA